MATERAIASGRPPLLRAIRRLLADPSLAGQLLNAQIRLRRAAQVPRTVRLQGHAWLHGGGEVAFGERVVIDGSITPVEFLAQPGGRIEVGEETFINYGVSISAHELVLIGRCCHIGHYTFIYDNDYHSIEDKLRVPPSRPVVLEDGVWLGTRVVVLKGVRIGHDAVIGAGSVVTHDVPPRTVVAGSPARTVRTF